MKDTSGAETPASDVLARISKEARRFFRKARGSHGWDHTERVVNLCLRIGKKEGADLEVLTLAAVLHDIGRGEEDRSNGAVCHSQSGVRLARGILKRHGVPERTAARVLHCIGTHRFRKKAGRRSLEAKVLFDADKLDSIGATGIGRAFLFAGEIGARLHDSNVDPDPNETLHCGRHGLSRIPRQTQKDQGQDLHPRRPPHRGIAPPFHGSILRPPEQRN
jgi:uncharacterized protein